MFQSACCAPGGTKVSKTNSLLSNSPWSRKKGRKYTPWVQGNRDRTLRCSERVSKRGPGKHLSHLQSRPADLVLCWSQREKLIQSPISRSPFPPAPFYYMFSLLLILLWPFSFFSVFLECPFTPLGFTSHSFPTLQSSVLCSPFFWEGLCWILRRLIVLWKIFQKCFRYKLPTPKDRMWAVMYVIVRRVNKLSCIESC